MKCSKFENVASTNVILSVILKWTRFFPRFSFADMKLRSGSIERSNRGVIVDVFAKTCISENQFSVVTSLVHVTNTRIGRVIEISRSWLKVQSTRYSKDRKFSFPTCMEKLSNKKMARHTVFLSFFLGGGRGVGHM